MRCGERRAYREEEVRDVVGDVYSEPHIRKVESITQPNQRHGDNMMPYELLEIFSWLL